MRDLITIIETFDDPDIICEGTMVKRRPYWLHPRQNIVVPVSGYHNELILTNPAIFGLTHADLMPNGNTVSTDSIGPDPETDEYFDFVEAIKEEPTYWYAAFEKGWVRAWVGDENARLHGADRLSLRRAAKMMLDDGVQISRLEISIMDDENYIRLTDDAIDEFVYRGRIIATE